MNEKDWNLLVTLSEEKTITHTAQKLCLTQPAVTRRIQQLEQELNCPIIIRGNKGVELSSEGEYLVEYARSALQKLDALKEYIDNRSGEVRGTLRITSANVYAKQCLPRLIKSFSAKYPAVDIHVITGNSQSIQPYLMSGAAHIALLRGSFSGPEQILPLKADPRYYVVSSFPLNLDDLPDLPQIQNVTDAPLEAELNLWWTSRYRKPPRVSTLVDRSDICIEMIRQGLGYSLLSGLYIQDQPDLYREKIVHSDGRELLRATNAYCRSSSLEIKAVRAFWEYLKYYDGRTTA